MEGKAETIGPGAGRTPEGEEGGGPSVTASEAPCPPPPAAGGDPLPAVSTERVSFVLPAHDELDSLPVLVDEIRRVAGTMGLTYDIWVVDDGSQDGSGAWLEEQCAARPDLYGLRFPENRGQSAALAAGLQACTGEVVVTMDSDLQNDPQDVVRLLRALEGHDLVCGVRATRHDRWSKRIGSRIGNGVRRAILGDRFRDVGCALKAWRRPVVQAVPHFNGFHRFIPILASAAGFRVREVEVSHRHRRYGSTHYGNLGRAARGVLDLFGVSWLRRRWVDTRGRVVRR